MLQNQSPCLLDVERFDLLGGHVQLAREHRDHPRLVFNVLLGFDGRGPRDGLPGKQVADIKGIKRLEKGVTLEKRG